MIALRALPEVREWPLFLAVLGFELGVVATGLLVLLVLRGLTPA